MDTSTDNIRILFKHQYHKKEHNILHCVTCSARVRAKTLRGMFITDIIPCSAQPSRFIRLYLPTYPPNHPPTYPPTHPLTHSHTFLPTCLSTHPLTYLPSYLSTHLPTYLPTYLPTHPYLPSYLPTHPPQTERTRSDCSCMSV